MSFPEDLHLSRQGYIDQFDDWHSSNHWLGTFEAHPSIDHRLRVWAELHVWGKRLGRKCRPVEWAIVLRMGRLTHDVMSSPAPCKSLRDARTQASKLNLTPHIKAILRAFYDPQRAECIWVRGTRPSQWDRLAHDGWVPHMTDFLGYDYGNLVSGEYAVVTRDFASFVHCQGLSTWSQGGGPESDKLRNLLPVWLPETEEPSCQSQVLWDGAEESVSVGLVNLTAALNSDKAEA